MFESGGGMGCGGLHPGEPGLWITRGNVVLLKKWPPVQRKGTPVARPPSWKLPGALKKPPWVKSTPGGDPPGGGGKNGGVFSPGLIKKGGGPKMRK